MMKKIFVAMFVFIFVLSYTPFAMAQQNGEGQGNQNEETITICHANEGVNGFVVLEVDPSSVDGEGQNDHTSHEGDIIPIEDQNGDNEITVEDCQIAAGWFDDGDDEGDDEEIVCTEENGPTLIVSNPIIKVYSGTTLGLLDFLSQFSYEVNDPDGGDVVVEHNARDLFPLPGFGTYIVSVTAIDDEGCSRGVEISVVYEEVVNEDPNDDENPNDEGDDQEENPNDEGDENEDGDEETPTDEGDTNETPSDETGDSEESSTGGGSSSGSRRPVSGGQVLGEVLGATTEAVCPQFTIHHRRGDVGGEVSLIQDFLNQHMSAGLVVDGMYGPATEKAVHAFQQKYWEQIIKPWTPELSGKTTGRWYKTTRAWANELMNCRELPQVLEDTGRMYSTDVFVKEEETTENTDSTN